MDHFGCTWFDGSVFRVAPEYEGRHVMATSAANDDGASGNAVRAALGFLGIGARAGALVVGTQAVRDGVRAGGLYHVILARDAAAGQRAKLLPILEARRIPYHIAFGQEEIGAALGRPPVSAIGLSNPDMARRSKELLEAVARQGHQQGGS